MQTVPDSLYADLDFASQPEGHPLVYDHKNIPYRNLAKHMIELAVETGFLPKPNLCLENSVTVADADGVAVFKIGRRFYAYDEGINELNRLARWPLIKRSAKQVKLEGIEIPDDLVGSWKAVNANSASPSVFDAICVYTFRPDATASVFEPMFDETNERRFQVLGGEDQIVVRFDSKDEFPLHISALSETKMRLVFGDGKKAPDSDDWFEYEKLV